MYKSRSFATFCAMLIFVTVLVVPAIAQDAEPVTIASGWTGDELAGFVEVQNDPDHNRRPAGSAHRRSTGQPPRSAIERCDRVHRCADCPHDDRCRDDPAHPGGCSSVT